MTDMSRDTIPTISPVLFYEDLATASDWLCQAFGFAERTAERVTVEDGKVVHAELSLGDGMVILSAPYDDFRIPARDSSHHQCLYVSVEDAAAHKAQTIATGAELVSDLRDTDYGAKVYAATDLAGYHWIFAETLSHS